MDARDTSSSNAVRVTVPHDHDILLGRGGGVNSHPGNRRFRRWVSERKEAYTCAKTKKEKGQIARDVVDLVHGLTPPGRFLQHEKGANYATTGTGNPYTQGAYLEVVPEKALAKTAQALREGAPNLRAHFARQSDHEGAASIYEIHPKTLRIKLPPIPRVEEESSPAEESPTLDDVDQQDQNLGSEIDDKQQTPATVSSEGEEWSMKKSDISKASCDASEKHRLTEEENETDTSKVAEDSFESAPKKQKHDHHGGKESDLALEESVHKDRMLLKDTPKEPQDDSLLHALATTCALTQSPSPVEEEDKPNLSAPPLTPENNKSNKLMAPVSPPLYSPDSVLQSGMNSTYPAMLQALAMEVAQPSAYAHPCFSAELMLSPLENARLKKEKTVQEWLIMAVPHLHTDDIRTYTRRLVDDGFDSVEMMVQELLEEDLAFMKKAHRRSLLRVQKFLQQSALQSPTK